MNYQTLRTAGALGSDISTISTNRGNNQIALLIILENLEETLRSILGFFSPCESKSLCSSPGWPQPLFVGIIGLSMSICKSPVGAVEMPVGLW